jgi:hypothetical protein
VVRQETALVATHAEVVDEEGVCGGGIRGGIEVVGEGCEDLGDVAVEVADFAGYRPD